MQELFPVLQEVLQGAMTRHVTSSGTQDGDDMKYYDDFLGDADLDAHNKTEVWLRIKILPFQSWHIYLYTFNCLMTVVLFFYNQCYTVFKWC